MYVRAQYRPRTLGDATIPWWAWVLDPVTTYGVWKAYGSPPSSSPVNLNPIPIVPGSSASDVFMNALTGKPTDAQIGKNTQDCITGIQRMRAVAGSNVPVGAEDKCLTDQQAYVKLIGGTANKKTTSIGAYAVLALFGLGALYVISR